MCRIQQLKDLQDLKWREIELLSDTLEKDFLMKWGEPRNFKDKVIRDKQLGKLLENNSKINQLYKELDELGSERVYLERGVRI